LRGKDVLDFIPFVALLLIVFRSGEVDGSSCTKQLSVVRRFLCYSRPVKKIPGLLMAGMTGGFFYTGRLIQSIAKDTFIQRRLTMIHRFHRSVEWALF